MTMIASRRGRPAVKGLLFFLGLRVVHLALASSYTWFGIGSIRPSLLVADGAHW